MYDRGVKWERRGVEFDTPCSSLTAKRDAHGSMVLPKDCTGGFNTCRPNRLNSDDVYVYTFRDGKREIFNYRTSV